MITLTLTLALIHIATAQTPSYIQTFFSKDYAGISLTINAPNKALPGENLAIGLWINCTSAGVEVDYLNFSVYGFRGGQEKILLNITTVLLNTAMSLNETIECNYNITLASDVWGAAYGELNLKYTVVDEPLERNAGFPMTIVRDVRLDELEQQLRDLNETCQQLNSSNWELQQECDSLRGNLGQLESTRQAAIALAITTVFFVATTIFLIMRKPKQSW